MKLTRTLGISVAAAAVLVSGCTSTVEGRAQDDGKGCKISRVTMQCYDPSEIDPAATTSPAPTPQSNPIPAGTDGVKACDGSKCTFTAADDEISRLVSESLTDVAHMWSNLNVLITLTMYKGGIGKCDGDGDETATAWVCPSTQRGGWSPAAVRNRAAEKGTTISDTVRSIVAHEMGHMAAAKFGVSSDDFVTNELRADCFAAGYSRWTMKTTDSAMGQLPVETMKRVLAGPRRNAAIDAGYNGTPKTCSEYTP